MTDQTTTATTIGDRVGTALKRVTRRENLTHVGDGFTVLSFNVGNGLADPTRLAEYLGDEQADIVGIQELSVPQAQSIERHLMDVYPYRLLFPSGFSGKGLLSKTPIREGASVSFAPDRPDLNAAIDVLDRRLRVIVAHPRPPTLSRTGVLFDEVTDSQIRKVGQMAINESPSVVLGDFNMTARQPQYAQLIEAGLIDACHALGKRGATFPRRVGHTHRVGNRVDKWPLRPILRIDYVLHTAELTASSVWLGEDAGSDHIPVFARLSWSDEDLDT